MVGSFYLFSAFSGLKPNFKKMGIGAVKRVQVEVCGLHCIDLYNMLKILGTHFSCNKKLKEEKKLYKTVTDIQRVLKI